MKQSKKILLFFFILLLSASLCGCESKDAIAKYEQIEDTYLDSNYREAVDLIKSFRLKYAEKNKKTAAYVEEIYAEIDQSLYQKVISQEDPQDIVNACGEYFSILSDGIYHDEVDNAREEAWALLAPQHLQEARQQIAAGDVLAADSSLSQLLYHKKISDEIRSEAEKLKESIATQVELERPIYAGLTQLASDAGSYHMRNVIMSTDCVIFDVDREREFLYLCPVSDGALGYDYSFILGVHYGKLSDKSKWGSISTSGDLTKIQRVEGIFKIYSNRINEGYIEAEYIH